MTAIVDIDKKISPLIAEQFPSFYKDEGPTFIAFVKAYFEWMEQEAGLITQARSLPTYRDIDTTLDQFVESFRAKYMVGIPTSVLGDKRLLMKHIREIYASKGTARGLELLFRILFNEQARVYIPGDDVLRPSDGQWVVPTYLEMNYSPYLSLLIGEVITGRLSGATAYVENVKTLHTGSRRINLLVITNVTGQFVSTEEVLSSVLTVQNSPRVIGSLNEVDIVDGGLNFAVGDIVDVVSGLSGTGGVAVVTRVGTRDGAVIFDVVNGGSGYTNSAFDVAAGLEPPDAPTTEISVTGGGGTGAGFRIGRLIGTETVEVFLELISTATDVGAIINDPAYTWAPNTAATMDTPLNETFDSVFLQIGTIADELAAPPGLIGVNPGANYTSNPTTTVINDLIAGHRWSDGNGGYKGMNATITSVARFGDGSIEEVRVIDSGVGYKDEESVQLVSNTNPIQASGLAIVSGQGQAQGYFTSSRGFLNSNKFIHDNHYYQEFSYEVQSSLQFEKYSEILRQIWHPVGTERFGAIVIVSDVDASATVAEENLELWYNWYISAYDGANTVHWPTESVPSTQFSLDIEEQPGSDPEWVVIFTEDET